MNCFDLKQKKNVLRAVDLENCKTYQALGCLLQVRSKKLFP